MKQNRGRKKIAIWLHGGLGGGLFGQGFPMIVQIIEELARYYDITVYSASHVPPDFHIRNYNVCSPSANARWSFFKWMYLVFCFIRDQFRNKFDILYSFWGYPVGVVVVSLGKLFALPSIVNILGSETADIPEIPYGFLGKKTRRRVLMVLRHATEVIAVSAYQIEKLRARNFHREIKLIPWGSDLKQFYPVKRNQELPLRILHVANLNEVKDQETLIKTFDIIRKKIPARLRIVGADYLNGKIHRLVNDMQLTNDVEFTGPVPHRQIAEHYHWADVFMLTSLSEGQNNSTTEAMTCGVLVAGTAVGILYDLKDQAVIAVPVRNHQQLAEQVLSHYHTPELWERKKEASVRWAVTHDLSWTITNLRNVIDHVIDG